MRPLIMLAFVSAALNAQASVPPAAQQIAAAVLPLPIEMRGGATVMGFREPGKLVVLREGNNGMHCLALYVTRPDFHVACYHKGLEPFMARGRELRAQGVAGGQVDSVRYAEIRSGKLKMPAIGSLYSVTASRGAFNASTNSVTNGSTLTVLYVPGATPESIGISAKPRNDGLWLMSPGTPKAHVMIAGKME